MCLWVKVTHELFVAQLIERQTTELAGDSFINIHHLSTQYYLTFSEDVYYQSTDYGQYDSQSVYTDQNYSRDQVHFIHTGTVVRAFIASFATRQTFELIIIQIRLFINFLVILLFNLTAVKVFGVGIGVRKVIASSANTAIAASFETLIGDRFTLQETKLLPNISPKI